MRHQPRIKRPGASARPAQESVHSPDDVSCESQSSCAGPSEQIYQCTCDHETRRPILISRGSQSVQLQEERGPPLQPLSSALDLVAWCSGPIHSAAVSRGDSRDASASRRSTYTTDARRIRPDAVACAVNSAHNLQKSLASLLSPSRPRLTRTASAQCHASCRIGFSALLSQCGRTFLRRTRRNAKRESDETIQTRCGTTVWKLDCNLDCADSRTQHRVDQRRTAKGAHESCGLAHRSDIRIDDVKCGTALLRAALGNSPSGFSTSLSASPR